MFTSFWNDFSFLSFEFSVVPLNCVFESNFHDRLVLTTVAPIVIVFGVFLTCLVLRQQLLSKGGDDINAAASSLTVSSIRLCVMVLFTVFPMVSATIFQTFSYDDRLNDGSAYLNADYSIEKRGSTHHGFVVYAIIMCLLYCFGIPAASWCVLRQKKDKIQLLMAISECITAIEGDEILESQHPEDILAHQQTMTIRLQKQVVTESTRRFKSTRRFISDFDEISFSRSDPIRTKESLNVMKAELSEEDPWLLGLSPLFKDYKRGYWWFEVPKFISTVILCGPLTLIPVEGASQVYISIVVSMFMLVLFANCQPYVAQSNNILAQCCQMSLTFAMTVGLLAKASESSQDALFGPLLIVCTTLNLGLGIAAMAFELAVTFVTEMPFVSKWIHLLPLPSRFKLRQERNSSVAPTSSTFHDGASHLQCEVGTAVQHGGEEASFRVPTITLTSSELHEDDQVQSISLGSNEKVHSRRNPDISGKAIAFVAEST